MKLLLFLLGYFRRYAVLAVVAAFFALFFALSTAMMISLVDPVLGEVLLADGVPSVVETLTNGPTNGGGMPADSAQGLEAQVRVPIRGLNLKARLDEAYFRLKETFGVTDQTVVYFLPLLAVIVFLGRGLTGFLSAYAFQQIGLRVTTDIRNDLYSGILSQSSRFHAEHPSGELISRIVSDVGMIQTVVSYRVIDLVQQSLTLAFLVALLLSTHLQLALICLVLTPMFVFPIIRFGKGMRKSSHRSQERMADLANLVAESVRGHRVVKAFNMEEFEFDRFSQVTRRHLRINLWAQFLSTLSSPVVESLGVMGMAALLVYAGRQIRAGELSASLFVAFLVNLIWMYEPVRKLNKVNLVLQQSLAAARRVYDVMEIPSEIEEKPDALELQGVEQGIVFDKVSFAYDAPRVLHEVDLTIRKGETVALVGPSGAGKSTLINLLPRFFDPDAGSVSIDGIDIRDVTLDSLHAVIGMVTQVTVLFDDTIRNNIAYGRRDMPLVMIREAAAAAYADKFIMEMPKGYETVIGESGLRLSSGQRQRLAIARALLKNAPMLILDEATSHLDSESEYLVQKALHNLMQGRTTLVIAHRLSTVMSADRIVVVDDGRIVEGGAHEELLKMEGVYRRLYDLQFDV
ncbi:MAG: ABC transporter transmembrane domain-containing protein [Thermoanaerobaculia bacterium]